ncbi:ditrans,polycis-undecaprenyl-diphosphate synthase ((2E,6E)-farnesyl-diphosphate specific) [Kushneria pakistanensis]|uniref:Ditrans,polycis-undecaprenyl-diphosphate synthase ((2E,6E)-farnesyl-diphosphate specific) n=1 Tax=Kushneria pakistanensis TaxID=1508770 RepID=A0ABQ3FM08_9GAMM|nr:polyprenyl diphosphate synthase [Kushneria pakistanensis]GHC28735.1 ditrans,polycis-undecaprenyl-diphosphate synthase ((2E,6E)-farnesyl-diphosphate specific) [Kushneria pakistanensis]
MTPDKFSNMPRHVAIIMDGNNRWAKARGLSGVRGHHAGVESVRAVIKRAAEHHLEAVTLFAFSSENWKRPAQEVSALMELFIMALKREVSRLHKNGIRLCIIGDRSRLSSSLNRAIERAEHLTRHNQGLRLIIAVNYGGRWDITCAAQRLARQVEAGQLAADDIDETLFDREMAATEVPEVDLCIRTSGEQRISNFLLWQMAYAEFYFSPLYWPDFDADAFDEALGVYSGRKRRFGMTDEQIEVQGA